MIVPISKPMVDPTHPVKITIPIKIGSRSVRTAKPFPKIHQPSGKMTELAMAPRRAPNSTFSSATHQTGKGESKRSSISRANNDALHVVAGLVTTANIRQIVQRANATGLPSIYSLLIFAQQGGVMAYSANSADLYRRAASYVAKLLKGSKPVDLPVEFPTKFELIINLKTAKEMGLTIPPTLLARADEVIE